MCPRVLVAGGGAAGVAAAVEAASSGAEVQLLESSDRLAPNRSLLPYLLSGRCTPEEIWSNDPDELSEKFEIEVSLGQQVRSVDEGAKSLQTTASGGGRTRHPFDSLVIATGSSLIPEEVKGTSKPGVFQMDAPEDYLAVARSVPKLSRIAVVGTSAPLALVVAQELSVAVKVTLFLSAGAFNRLSPCVRKRVTEAAASHGVEVVDGGVRTIVGMNRVEAVISRDGVRPCDAVAILPRSSPSLPDVGCQTGINGGAIVDRSMRTSSKGVFAAGDCAELRLGTGSIPLRLHSSALVMGRTAGGNAARGGLAEAGLAGSFALDVFGTEVCMAGIDVTEGRAVGLGLIEMEDEDEANTDGGTSEGAFRASMVFERDSHRVYGIQAAGRGALSLSGYVSAIVSSHASLEEIFHQESPYRPLSDKGSSPICLTAGRFLERVRV
jgi:NADPH-dependent 2,4-dienoyl-CoA reductase/sulfur reductase-like enzyme